MGDSEFIGGGSVEWKVKPSKGDPGHGNPNGAKGKDKDPQSSSDPNAQFTITATNPTGATLTPQPDGSWTVPVNGTTIKINWPASPGTASRITTAKPTAMSTARRATTTKKTARSSKTAPSAKTARSAKKK